MNRISQERASWLDPYHAERAALLCSLLGLGEPDITQPALALPGGRSGKDILAHIAAWERHVADHIDSFRASDQPPLPPISVDSFNAKAVEERDGHSVGEVIDEMTTARLDIVRALASTSDADISRPHTMPTGQQTTLRQWAVETYIAHDRLHRREIEEWVGTDELEATSTGHGVLAAAALDATFRELMIVAQLARQAVGRGPMTPEGWTVVDFLGHVADWDHLTLEPLRQVAAGKPVTYEDRPVETHEGRLNEYLREKRRGQTWEEVQAELTKTRGEIVTLLRGLPAEALAQRILCPWPEEGTVYYMVTDLTAHDREHAALFRRVYQAQRDAQRQHGESALP